MAYDPTNWEDFPSIKTQITAAKLNKIENQLVKLSKNPYEIPNDPSPNQWFYIGRIKMIEGQGQFAKITIFCGNGQNSRADQNLEVEIFLKRGWQTTQSLSEYVGVTYNLLRMNSGATLNDVKVKVMHSEFGYLDVYVYFSWRYAKGYFKVEGTFNSFEYQNTHSSETPNTGTEQPCAGGVIAWTT